MSKRTTPVNWYYVGVEDGLKNRPKQRLKGDNQKAYNNGYAEGHGRRSRK